MFDTNTPAAQAAETVLTDAHRELTRMQARTGGDWARDGYSIQAAQIAVEKAEADYRDAFAAYRTACTVAA